MFKYFSDFSQRIHYINVTVFEKSLKLSISHLSIKCSPERNGRVCLVYTTYVYTFVFRQRLSSVSYLSIDQIVLNTSKVVLYRKNKSHSLNVWTFPKKLLKVMGKFCIINSVKSRYWQINVVELLTQSFGFYTIKMMVISNKKNFLLIRFISFIKLFINQIIVNFK